MATLFLVLVIFSLGTGPGKSSVMVFLFSSPLGRESGGLPPRPFSEGGRGWVDHGPLPWLCLKRKDVAMVALCFFPVGRR